jgi:riboflavin kinase/FMN adenylyltransferase
MLSGTVVNGKQLGGKIGYPTANINIKETYKLIPKTGVYIVSSKIQEVNVYGMMNIGNRPTIGGNHQTIEVHFFDFNANLYQQQLTIKLLYFLRDEQKFDSIEHLILQLKKDEQTARDFITKNL